MEGNASKVIISPGLVSSEHVKGAGRRFEGAVWLGEEKRVALGTADCCVDVLAMTDAFHTDSRARAARDTSVACQTK